MPTGQCEVDILRLNEREVHHALHVLRVRDAERVVVLDGAGHELLCEARISGRDKLQLKVVQRNSIPQLPCQITLVQAIPKGKIIESIIQKATELGVHRIVPLLSDRVVSQLDDEGANSKVERWRTTAVEAVKQSGCPWLPRVDSPVTPREYLARNEKFELSLIGSLQSDARHPRECIQAVVNERKRLPKSVAIWIGPEGDFTPAELIAAKSAGALPITLGRLVLRTETAAIYTLSILNYELQSPPA